MAIKKQIGFTLIEVMLSVVISFFLLSALITLYLSVIKTHQSQIELTQLSSAEEKSIAIFKNQLEKADTISGDRDSITMRYANMRGDVLAANMTNPQSLTVTKNSERFKEGDELVVSDGIHTAQFKVASVYVAHQEQYLQSSEPLPFLFKAPAEMGKSVINHYYLNTKKSSLSVQDAAGDHHQLVSGISALHFLYYVTADPMDVLPEGVIPRAVEVTVTTSPPFSKTIHAFLPVKNHER